MLSTAIIVFREVLEAALITGIVLAATRGVAKRGMWVSFGVAGGVAGACLVALFAGELSAMAAGFGQEILNATILFVAVAMLAWHQIWMSSHGKEIAVRMRGVGKSVAEGASPMYALAIVVGVAVLREGAETVLFLYGIATSAQESAATLGLGGLLGLATGAAVGAALYFGLLKIPTKSLFTVTGWMIVLVAAGMASQGAAFLVQAGLLPTLVDHAWNTSAFMSQTSVPGRVFHTLIGYDDRPTGIQIVFYLVTLMTISVAGHLVSRPSPLKQNLA